MYGKHVVQKVANLMEMQESPKHRTKKVEYWNIMRKIRSGEMHLRVQALAQ